MLYWFHPVAFYDSLLFWTSILFAAGLVAITWLLVLLTQSPTSPRFDASVIHVIENRILSLSFFLLSLTLSLPCPLPFTRCMGSAYMYVVSAPTAPGRPCMCAAAAWINSTFCAREYETDFGVSPSLPPSRWIQAIDFVFQSFQWHDQVCTHLLLSPREVRLLSADGQPLSEQARVQSVNTQYFGRREIFFFQIGTSVGFFLTRLLPRQSYRFRRVCPTAAGQPAV